MNALAEELRARGVEEIIVATWQQEDDWQAIGGHFLQELLPHGDPNGKLRFSRLLQTAASLIASSGLRTSLQEIADAAGILPGSLYHHFESKEAILVELIHRYQDDLNRIGQNARQFANFDSHARHLSAFGDFRHKLDNAAGDGEFVHGRPSADTRKLLADEHVDDALSAEYGLHRDASGRVNRVVDHV